MRETTKMRRTRVNVTLKLYTQSVAHEPRLVFDIELDSQVSIAGRCPRRFVHIKRSKPLQLSNERSKRMFCQTKIDRFKRHNRVRFRSSWIFLPPRQCKIELRKRVGRIGRA